MGHTLAEAGGAISLTSGCNAAVFCACALILPLAGLQRLLTSSALVVVANWLSAVTLIPVLLSLWAQAYEQPLEGGGEMGDGSGEAGWEGGVREASGKGEVPRVLKAFSESRGAKLAVFAAGVGLLLGFSLQIPNVEFG